VDESLYRVWDGVVRYIDGSRAVYEIQTRLSEWAGAEGEAVPPDTGAMENEGRGATKENVEADATGREPGMNEVIE
jgi:hypothetical protein